MQLKKIRSLPVHTDRIWASAPHPNLPILATASGDRTTQIISLSKYTAITTLDGGHKRSIRSIAWHPTSPSPVLATGSFDSTCGIWRSYPDSAPGEYEFAVVLDGHEFEIKSVAWSAGGTFLATCSRDKSVWIWEELDEDNFETVAVLQEHTQDVKCVCWHPAELLLASASYDDTIRLYREDVDDWVCVAVLEGHERTVWSVQFEPGEGSRRLLSCSDDLEVRIWERVATTAKSNGASAPPSILRGEPLKETWEHKTTLPKAHDRSIYSISWSPRSGRIVSCGGDGRIVVYQEDKTTAEWTVVAKTDCAHGVYEVNNVVWSKRYDKEPTNDNDEIIISCGDDGEVNIWEVVD